MVSREFKEKLWAERYKKFPKPEFKKKNPIQEKLNTLTKSVMTEVLNVNPKQVIQAVMELASYMKTIGMGKDAYVAIMENLEIMATEAGRPPGEIRKYIRNKEYYLGKSNIMVL